MHVADDGEHSLPVKRISYFVKRTRPSVKRTFYISSVVAAILGGWLITTAQQPITTPAAGNGTTVSTDPRVNVASDNSAIANWGHGATGSAVPSGATYSGFQASGNLVGGIICDSKKVYDASTNGSTLLVAKVAAKNIYVCGYDLFSAGTVNVKLISGTQTTNPCDTSTVNETPAWQLIAQVGLVDNHYFGNSFKIATNTDLCINTSAGVAVQAMVYYTQF